MSGDQIKDDDIGEVCDMHGREEKGLQCSDGEI
jgi:hypothetical protein